MFKKLMLKKLRANFLISALLLSLVSFGQIEVKVVFLNGFAGTKGSSNNSVVNIRNFATLGVSRAYFIQNNPTEEFIAQGNDIPGILRLKFTNSTIVDINGAINWRGPSGNSIEYFGFIPAPTVAPYVVNLPGGGTYTLDNTSNYGLFKNSSTLSYADATDVQGNAANTGILDALNAYLLAQKVRGGDIGSNQTICGGGTPATLTAVTFASGGVGPLTAQWQSSTNNINFTDVASGGTNPIAYSPGPLTTTTYFRRAATDGDLTGYSDTVTITITAVPATPGQINGPLTIPAGATQTYSVTAVPGATSYTWTLPSGWTGTSTTNSITVTASTNTGNISVVANASGCTSGASILTVSVSVDSDGDGIPDAIEGNGDSDGDGIPNYLDLDSDNDGIPDSLEDAGCNGSTPCTPTDTDGDGIPNYLDTDSDGDGIPDSLEDAGCNGTAPCTPTDTDGDGIPNYLDLDSDNDGIPDSLEDAGCNGTAPCTPTDTDGDGIPNYLDTDSDGDGIPDSVEDAGCTGTAPCTPTDTDGDGTPNYLDLDSDNDGIPDSLEDAGCTGTAPCTPTDTDGDGTPNYLDLDSDGDGIPDSVEDAGCNGIAPCTPTDTDGDGTPNYLDLDSDGDGIPDSIEAGPNPSTPRDTDGDGTPDYLDLDSDNDGIPDSVEDAGCNGLAPCTPTDTDGDGTPNYLDLDSDGDGIPDSIEAGLNPSTPRDTDGDGTPDYLDLDSDNDGIPDSLEDAGCNGIAPCTPTDTDGDGTPNYLDLDSDNDGIPDSLEDAGCNGTAPCTPTDTDGDGTPNYLDLDSDNDGIPDSLEDAGCNGTAPCTPTDTDGDGTPNYLDLDSDNDGIPDSLEDAGCNGTAPCTPTDTDGDGTPNYLDLDSDNDGIPDALEDTGCNGTAPCTPTDTDGDGIPNYLDLDSDNDGILDSVEDAGCNGTTPCTPTDSDGDGTPNYLDLDSDNDGCSDANEAYNSQSAQGADGNLYYGNGNPPTVNASGQVVGATYPAPGTNYTTLGAAPVISAEPSSQLVQVGGNTSFQVTASVSTGTVSYQWQISTNGGTSWSDLSNISPYSGVTTSTLALTGVSAAIQNAQFRVIAYQAGYICSADTSSGSAALSINLPPTAVNDISTTPEDQPLNGNVLTNDSDPNSNPLSVTQFTVAGVAGTFTAGQTATIPGVGTLVINANGTYTFTPVANYNGPVPVATYTVSDGQGGTATATLTITVTAVNDAPVAVNDVATTPEDQPVSGDVLTNDTDLDGNPLSVTQFSVAGVAGTFTAGQTATIPGVGTLVINANGTYTFTPVANYNGPVPVATYTVSDGQGGTATATLTITVTAVNDLPVAVNDVVTTLEDQPVSGNVLTNDTDVDGNPLTVTQFVVGGQTYTAGTTANIPGVGTLVISSNGNFVFTPAPNYNGTVPPVLYTISDGQGGTATATLQITVQSVADPEDITISTTAVCGVGPVTLTASTSTVPSPVFRWYSDAALSNLLFTGAAYSTPAITSTTTYYVSVSGTGVQPNTAGNGKSAVATILPVPVRPSISANGPLTFCKDDSVALDAGVATSYQWFKNGSAITGATQRTLLVKEQGDYTVLVTNSSGCASQPSAPAVVRVPCVKGIYMPTVFTPNKDGKNETVKPSVPGMKKFQCYKIYNRWGNLIFDNQGVLQGWDGTFKGVTQPADTYLWVVQGEDGQGKPMRASGQITLIR